MLMSKNSLLISIEKRSFCNALFLFLFFFNLIGQEKSVSDSTKNDLLAKYNGFKTTPVNPLLQAKYDSLLTQLGIEKKFFSPRQKNLCLNIFGWLQVIEKATRPLLFQMTPYFYFQ